MAIGNKHDFGLILVIDENKSVWYTLSIKVLLAVSPSFTNIFDITKSRSFNTDNDQTWNDQANKNQIL